MAIFLLNVCLIIVATLWDIATRRIPNLITIGFIVAGLSINSYSSGLSGLKNSVLGLLLGLALLILPFALGGIGAGDVKLLAAVGALNGPHFVFYTFLYGAIAGGVIALAIIFIRGQLFPVLFNVAGTLRSISVHIFSFGKEKQEIPETSGIKFPYAICIFTGAIATYLMG